jgi:hypothetical protein
MIQRRNQLQNDILSNNLNNPISMLGSNFAMMYNNSNNQYFTNPHNINNGDFRMNVPQNSNFIYPDRAPKKNQRSSQKNGSSQQAPNQQNHGLNIYSNMNNVINLNSVINPNPYSNNLNSNNPPNNGNVSTGNGNNGSQQPKKDDKKTTSNQNIQGGSKKK